MDIKYFAIFDSKAQMFGGVFPSHTLGSAERSLKESVSNPDSTHAKYPDDFSLYLLFELDDETGIISKTYEPPQLVVQASALVSP